MSTEATTIANYHAPAIQRLIEQRGWRALSPYDRIGAAYTFVRDEIRFGYNASDDVPATDVLRDGYGQCNTKGNLLVALLRGLGLPTRFHGATIFKTLQGGAVPMWLMPLAPKRILHSWVEVLYEERWIKLEGFIIDKALLSQVQKANPAAHLFLGFGIATPCLHKPEVDWTGRDTFIQREGLADDFGVYTDPDAFYREHGTNLGGLRRLLYVHVLRHLINRNVEQIRQGRRSPAGSVSSGSNSTTIALTPCSSHDTHQTASS